MRNYQNDESTKRAVAYARFSSDMQREESIDAQLRAIKAYANSHGYELVSNFIDKAKSGMNDKRDEFQKMIKLASDNKFDAVIVHKLDRFSRNRYDAINYKIRLRNNNVKVISATEKIDDTPEGELLEGVIESVNQMYSKNLARETLKGLKENAYKTISTGGMPPLGYNVDDNKKLIINPKEARAVRLIFDMYLKHYSYPKIINILNELNYKTKKNNPFGKNSLYEILKNEKYTGVFVYNKMASKRINGKRNTHKYKPENEIIRIKNGCPAIISQGVFVKAQEKLKLRSLIYQSKHSRFDFLLAGIIKCNKCGSAYCGLSKQRKKDDEKYYHYYACTNNYMIECTNKLIRQDFIELAIYNTIIAKLKCKTEVSSIINNIINNLKNALNTQEHIEKQLVVVKEKIDNLIELIILYNNTSLIEKLTMLEIERDVLENKIFCFNNINISKIKKHLIQKSTYIISLDKSDILKEHIKSVSVGIDYIKAEVIIFDDYTFDIEFKRDVK